MTQKELEELTNSMQEKLGQEASGLIMDDIGKLITDNAQMNDTIKSKDSQITRLQNDKENLLAVNGNLLQQVAMGDSYIEQNKKEEPEIKPITFKSCFDEKRKFY